MTDKAFAIACLLLQDQRSLIAAGKAQRWDVVKWVVAVNLGCGKNEGSRNPSGNWIGKRERGNLQAGLRLVSCPVKERGPPVSGPKSLDVHRRGRRCDHSKAVIQGVRCDHRHSRRHGTCSAFRAPNLFRWSRGSAPRLLRLTLDRLPDRASGERPRGSKACPYLKARLADSNVFVLLCHLDCRSGWLATLAAM